jgi:hypothetical protein
MQMMIHVAIAEALPLGIAHVVDCVYGWTKIACCSEWQSARNLRLRKRLFFAY